MEATEQVALPARSSDDGGDLVRVIAPDGRPDPASDPKLDAAEAVSLYEAMVRTRVIGDRLVELGREGHIGVHAGAQGFEAAVVGAVAALRDQDWLFPSRRDHGAFLWRGMALQSYLDQVFANAEDLARGRQMPGHATGRAFRIGSVGSLAGTHLPHAVGFAWGARIRGDGLVSAAFFGDEAVGTGDFHTALNFAGVFRIPVVFVCRTERGPGDEPEGADAAVADRAIAYGLGGVRCDGSDVLATYRAVRDAVERASVGEGPTLVECRTVRLEADGPTGDSGGWPARHDPLERARKYLETIGAWDVERERSWRDEVRAELDGCVARASEKPAPALEALVSDVYGSTPWHLREQERVLMRGPRSDSNG